MRSIASDVGVRVAKWLGEVFGGPPRYSDEYGGYPRMLSQHVGKGLTEQWRGRWVALLLQSAQEAGLPNDAGEQRPSIIGNRCSRWAAYTGSICNTAKPTKKSPKPNSDSARPFTIGQKETRWLIWIISQLR